MNVVVSESVKGKFIVIEDGQSSLMFNVSDIQRAVFSFGPFQKIYTDESPNLESINAVCHRFNCVTQDKPLATTTA